MGFPNGPGAGRLPVLEAGGHRSCARLGPRPYNLHITEKLKMEKQVEHEQWKMETWVLVLLYNNTSVIDSAMNPFGCLCRARQWFALVEWLLSSLVSGAPIACVWLAQKF